MNTPNSDSPIPPSAGTEQKERGEAPKEFSSNPHDHGMKLARVDASGMGVWEPTNLAAPTDGTTTPRTDISNVHAPHLTHLQHEVPAKAPTTSPEPSNLLRAMLAHDAALLEDDSIVASCGCGVKTNEVKYHKPGCKYRLICERDDAKADAANQREELKKRDLIEDNYRESCVRLEDLLALAEKRLGEAQAGQEALTDAPPLGSTERVEWKPECKSHYVYSASGELLGSGSPVNNAIVAVTLRAQLATSQARLVEVERERDGFRDEGTKAYSILNEEADMHPGCNVAPLGSLSKAAAVVTDRLDSLRSSLAAAEAALVQAKQEASEKRTDMGKIIVDLRAQLDASQEAAQRFAKELKQTEDYLATRKLIELGSGVFAAVDQTVVEHLSFLRAANAALQEQVRELTQAIDEAILPLQFFPNVDPSVLTYARGKPLAERVADIVDWMNAQKQTIRDYVALSETSRLQREQLDALSAQVEELKRDGDAAGLLVAKVGVQLNAVLTAVGLNTFTDRKALMAENVLKEVQDFLAARTPSAQAGARKQGGTSE